MKSETKERDKSERNLNLHSETEKVDENEKDRLNANEEEETLELPEKWLVTVQRVKTGEEETFQFDSVIIANG